MNPQTYQLSYPFLEGNEWNIFNFLTYRRWKEMCRFYHSKTNSAIKVDKTKVLDEKWKIRQFSECTVFWTYGTFVFYSDMLDCS